MKAFVLVVIVLLVGGPFVMAADVQAKPEGVDLDVLVIERTPRYPGYVVDYSDGSGQGSVDKSQVGKKHWPEVGEEVTFTGKIGNKGTKTAPEFDYEWMIDGKKVRGGTVKGLAPGATAEVTLKWKWVARPHVVELIADPTNKVKETFEQNNRLFHDTMAKVLHLVVSQDTYDRMNNCPNLIGTYSCEDQLNWYINHMNEMFKNAVYPMTPNGSRERVRAEFLVVKDAEAKDKWYAEHGGSTLTAGFDGGWWHDYGQNTAKWCSSFDWGLPHELGHQLGIIDLYQLDCPSEGNMAPDEDGDPIMIGHNCDMIDSMMHGHGPVPWSEHTAYATDTHFTKRRGFYGNYLVAMPEKNYVRILDNRCYRVEGAKITAYQTVGNRVAKDPVFSGVTDKDGLFLLPNRSIGKPRYTTELGYDYHDNPFGQIQCVGNNGLLFFKIQGRGQTEYQWLEITTLNLAYWRGEKDRATYVYKTGIPHYSTPPAPTNVTAERVDKGVKVSWTKCPDAPAVAAEKRLCPVDAGYTNAVVRYNVYRSVPDEYKWELIGTTNSRDPGEFIDAKPPQGTVRYAVTAVNTARSESAFSKFYGYSVLNKPMGIAVLPTGRLILCDSSQNQMTFMKPNGSTIGPYNSTHNHGYCTDVAVAKDGMVAYTDWPDGYDPKHEGFFLRDSNKDEMGKAVKKEIGPGDDQVDQAMGISFDDSGNVILTEAVNNRVTCYTRDGKKVWRADGFNNPSRAVVWQGRLAVADTGNDRVQLVDPNGKLDPLTIDGLKSPRYAMVDLKGRLIVSDTGDGVVKAYAFENGRPKVVGTIRPETQLQDPIGVADLGNGRYAIVDAGAKSVVFGRM